LVTALGSVLGKTVPRTQEKREERSRRPYRVVYSASHQPGQLGGTGLLRLREEKERRKKEREEGDPKRWSMVLITALGSWEKPVPQSHYKSDDHFVLHI
jgi:hypothetical protein